MEQSTGAKSSDILNDVYFELETAELTLNRIESLVKFGILSYDNVGAYESLDYFALLNAIDDKIRDFREELQIIKDKVTEA